jgi:N-glycosylase/DNA lyase
MDGAWSEWQVLERTGPRSLRCAPTLLSGMSFRWWRRKEGEEEEETFLGVLDGTICELKELDAAVCFRSSNPDTARALLRKHLRLDDGVDACEVAPWCEALPRFRRAAAAVPGCRVLRILDPLECLVTFIGSANNNIKRNMQMVRDLCADFEENRLGADPYGGEHYRFPSVAQLLSLSEKRLWELGWGYRAPRVFKVARQLEERGGEPFLHGLPLEEAAARRTLCELCGVGRKVADCILLFGYAHDSCAPHSSALTLRLLPPHSPPHSCASLPLTPPAPPTCVRKLNPAVLPCATLPQLRAGRLPLPADCAAPPTARQGCGDRQGPERRTLPEDCRPLP